MSSVFLLSAIMKGSAEERCAATSERYVDCMALNSASDRYKLCREIYPDQDVAALVREQTLLNPEKARPCMLRRLGEAPVAQARAV